MIISWDHRRWADTANNSSTNHEPRGVQHDMKSWASITEGRRRIELFTDRHELIRQFSNYLNEEPPSDRILFLHGDGGNGKSLLLYMLYAYYCKCLSSESWEWIKHRPDEEFEYNLKEAQGAEPVPAALVNFGASPVDEDNPQRAYSALLMLRRGLRSAAGGEELQFPLFDFAVTWYLRTARRLTKEKIKSLFPSEETNFISELLQLVFEGSSTVKLGTRALLLFDKYLVGERFTLYLEKRRLDESDINDIQKIPSFELADYLPRLFARDLNAMMSMPQGPKRIALFFDTHEAFWGHERDTLPTELYFERDEWLRDFVKHVELRSGIVVVLSGREPPRWSGAPDCIISNDAIECQFVGPLTESQAAAYLQSAGIPDDVKQCLLEIARVETDQIHPLYLGLCADVVFEAQGAGRTLELEEIQKSEGVAERGHMILYKLLRYADSHISTAVYALSTCRVFNKEIYQRLGREVSFESTDASFKKLTRFSFVWPAQQEGEGWYRIHELVRRILHEVIRKRDSEVGEFMDRADRAMVKYYSERIHWI
jgi:hypothetical protein